MLLWTCSFSWPGKLNQFIYFFFHSEAVALSKEQTPEIRTQMTAVRNMQKEAFIGSLKCIYWLVKENIAHTTKLKSIMTLLQHLGLTF